LLQQHIDSNAIYCPESNGFTQYSKLDSSDGVTLTSTKPEAELISLSPNGITIELWASFNNTDDSNGAGNDAISPIITFGQDNSVGTSRIGFACDVTPWYDFAIYSNLGKLEISSPYSPSSDDDVCLDTASNPIDFRASKHLVQFQHLTF
jgi:hypothetical protein